MYKKVIVLILLSIIVLPLFATAGGGLFIGNYNYNSDYSNISLGEKSYYYGGYGYGTDNYGVRNGGFGMVIFDEDDTLSIFKGAFGGMINGREAVYAPVIIGANLWTGVGYSRLIPEYSGVAGLIDGTAEVGISLFPWFHVAIYAGMQCTASFYDIMNSYTYTPVLGTRVIWGSFYQ